MLEMLEGGSKHHLMVNDDTAFIITWSTSLKT